MKAYSDIVFGTGYPCQMCRALRACEERVRQETFDADWSEMGQLAAVRLFRRQAFLAGLNAAREAVAMLAKETYCDSAPCWGSERYLAAIDALREEQK